MLEATTAQSQLASAVQSGQINPPWQAAMGSLLFTPDQLTRELKGLKKKGCSVCSHNLAFSKGQLAEKESQLTEQKVKNYQLIRENEALKWSVEDLLYDIGDLKLRLREAESREITIPQVRNRSRESIRYSLHGQPRNQSWMTPEERKTDLLKPFPHK